VKGTTSVVPRMAEKKVRLQPLRILSAGGST
jgi:hypothetical protein